MVSSHMRQCAPKRVWWLLLWATRHSAAATTTDCGVSCIQKTRLQMHGGVSSTHQTSLEMNSSIFCAQKVKILKKHVRNFCNASWAAAFSSPNVNYCLVAKRLMMPSGFAWHATVCRLASAALYRSMGARIAISNSYCCLLWMQQRALCKTSSICTSVLHALTIAL